jgi:hypothetical protein
LARLIWDGIGTRNYEAGVDRGVLYPLNSLGVPWNGIVSVNEAPSGSGFETKYMDGIAYQKQTTEGNFAATLEAFTYPLEFEQSDGLSEFATAQFRKPFNLSYRTMIGDDLTGLDAGYKIHLVYNVLAEPSSKTYQSIDEQSEPMLFSWNLSTTPIIVLGAKMSAHLIIDSRITHPDVLNDLEDILYGSDASDPVFPTADIILSRFDASALNVVTDNFDGSFTAEGPDVTYETSSQVILNWPTVVQITTELYTVSSY